MGMRKFKGNGVGFGFGIGCGFGIGTIFSPQIEYFESCKLPSDSETVSLGYGFGGAPIGIAGLGIGGGCGIGGAFLLLKIMKTIVDLIDRILCSMQLGLVGEWAWPLDQSI